MGWSPEVEETALAPEVEEAVPGQDVGWFGGCRVVAGGGGGGMSSCLWLGRERLTAAGYSGCDCVGGFVGVAELFQWR